MVTYSDIEEKDLPQIIDLYESYLNSGRYIRDSIREKFYKKDYPGVKACDSGEIVGFITWQEGIGFTYPHPELEEEIARIAGERRIYTLDGILLLEEYRSIGISEEMARRSRDMLMKRRVELALAEQWIYPDNVTIPARESLRGVGKAIYEKRVPMFYSELKKYRIRCPLCGSDCKCGALIELLEIGG